VYFAASAFGLEQHIELLRVFRLGQAASTRDVLQCKPWLGPATPTSAPAADFALYNQARTLSGLAIRKANLGGEQALQYCDAQQTCRAPPTRPLSHNDPLLRSVVSPLRCSAHNPRAAVALAVLPASSPPLSVHLHSHGATVCAHRRHSTRVCRHRGVELALSRREGLSPQHRQDAHP
jgi:hypothetical protein